MIRLLFFAFRLARSHIRLGMTGNDCNIAMVLYIRIEEFIYLPPYENVPAIRTVISRLLFVTQINKIRWSAVVLVEFLYSSISCI